jgi:signal transduction histidine kinase
MNQNRLFEQTRWRLAKWYAGILSLILGLPGLGVYEAIAHAHRITINQELQTVGGTLHDSLEPILQQPGKLAATVTNLLPDLCLVATSCSETGHQNRHLARAIQQGKYYIQFFDLSGRLVAMAGIKPEGLSRNYSDRQWQNLIDSNDLRYRQISLELHTQDDRHWGYLQIGRSLQDFDNYVANVKWIMLLGLPIVIVLVMFASWWLAGRAMQPIYQSYRQIQQFTADAAHELRTPLAAIQATVESSLMRPTLTEKETRETLKTIGRQNQRLSHLVADLLTLCRIDRQLAINAKSQMKQVALNDLVSDIAEEFAALALASEISLTSQIEVNHPLKVSGNEEQLYRLVANLVINAIQHTLKGGKVTLILKQKNNEALIEIVDTGIGIPEKEQKFIFDRFYRVNKARSRDRGGSGLGLSIAKAIATAHQGNIKVKSELGKGSTFTICLPIIN